MKHQLQSRNWLHRKLSNEENKLWIWGVCDAATKDSVGLPALMGERKGRLEHGVSPYRRTSTSIKWGRQRRLSMSTNVEVDVCPACLYSILQWSSLKVLFILEVSQWDSFVKTPAFQPLWCYYEMNTCFAFWK